MASPKVPRWRLWLSLLGQTIDQGFEDNIPHLGAALAFYALLSVLPMLVLLTSLATALYGTEIAREQIYQLALKFAGHEQAETIRGLLDAVSQHAYVGSKTAFFNFAILIYGASNFFTHLRGDLNFIWKTPALPGTAFIHILKENLLSFLMVLAIGVTVIASILANTFLTIMIHFTIGFMPALSGLMQIANLFLDFFVLVCAFALTFKFVPDKKSAWSDIRGGAILTACLFTAGQYAIRFYLSHALFLIGYGAAGSIVALLIWIYYCVQIFFFGAEFIHIYSHTHTSG